MLPLVIVTNMSEPFLERGHVRKKINLHGTLDNGNLSKFFCIIENKLKEIVLLADNTKKSEISR